MTNGIANRVLDSVEELLDPALLSEAAGQTVTAVTRRRLTADFAHSGSELYLVECETTGLGGAGELAAGGSEPSLGGDGASSPSHGLGIPGGGTIPRSVGPRFVLKRLAMEWDWLMRITNDDRCRSVALWEQGLFDRLLPEIDPCVVACARDGEGWAILMRDVGEFMVTNQRFGDEQNRRFLEAMAAMHAEFFEDPAPAATEVGLSELRHVYEMFAARTALRKDAGTGDILNKIQEGWKMVRTICPGEVVDVVEPLLDDPTPLVRALEQYPQTLVHGDFRHSNLAALPAGFAGGRERVALLDWQLAVYAPVSVELGRYIGANSPFLPGSKEALLSLYRDALARRLGSRFSEEWWVPQLELGLLGGFVQDGWAIALKATTWHVGEVYREHWRSDLEWWAERVRAGARWLA